MIKKFLWPIIAVTTVIAASIISGATAPVLAATVSGAIYVVSVSEKWKHANLFGAILAGFLAYLSYTAGFFGNAVFNLIFALPISLWGWWYWNKRANSDVPLERSLSHSKRMWLIAIGLVGFGASIAFSCFTGASMPIHDAFTTIVPIIATILLVGAYKEQWYCWIPYNLVECLMWFSAASVAPEVLAIFVMRVVFFINSLIGYHSWNKE